MIANIARDRFVNRTLRKQGWRVIRIWEHELPQARSQKSEVKRQKLAKRFRKTLIPSTGRHR